MKILIPLYVLINNIIGHNQYQESFDDKEKFENNQENNTNESPIHNDNNDNNDNNQETNNDKINDEINNNEEKNTLDENKNNNEEKDNNEEISNKQDLTYKEIEMKIQNLFTGILLIILLFVAYYLYKYWNHKKKYPLILNMSFNNICNQNDIDLKEIFQYNEDKPYQCYSLKVK